MHTKLRQQPDLILDEAGFWVLGSQDGDGGEQRRSTVGRCRLPVSKSVLKAPMVSALEIEIWINCFQSFAFKFNLRRSSTAMYSRASPDAADAAAVTRRIQDRQRGSKKRL